VYTELLANVIAVRVNDDQREQLGRVRVSADDLLTLIEDLLGFSRAQAGHERITVEPFDLAAAVNHVLVITTPLADRKGLALRCNLPHEPLPVRSDQRKVQQILLNLVANAIKFTERGEVSIDVVRSSEAVTIAVHDTGPGMPPEHLEKVFDPFWQANQQPSRSKGGTGLGLSIARQLAQLLGGGVTVSSVLGEGSTFTVTLPVSVPAEPAH
jgi:signal transduction histidine kinase